MKNVVWMRSVVLCLVVGVAPLSEAAEPSWDAVRAGVQSFRVGAHQQSVNILQPLVEGAGAKLGPASAAASYVLARAYAAKGQGKQAQRALRAARHRVKSVSAAAWQFAQVEVALAAGENKRAFGLLSALRKRWPKFRWARADLMWSRLYERIGPPKAAADAALSLVTKSRLHLPGDELVARAARLYTKVGKTRKARSLWLRLLMKYPHSKLVDQALAVVPLRTLSIKQRLARAELLFKRRDYERCRAEALFLWNKGVHRDSVGYLLGKIGSERLRDDYPGAVRYFKAAIGEGAPYAMFALASYAIALTKVGRHRKAVSAFDLWLKRHSGESNRRVNEVMYDRCRAIRGWGKPLRAAREYEAFLQRFKKRRKRGFDFGKYWWFVGFWRYLGGQYKAAIGIFDDLTYSKNALVGGKARYWKGKALDKMGRIKAATKIWSKLVRTMPLNYYSAMAEDNLRRLGFTKSLPKRFDLSKVPYRTNTRFRGLPRSAQLRRLQIAAHMGEWDTLREVLAEVKPGLLQRLGERRLTQLISDLSDELEDFYTDRGRAYREHRKALYKWPNRANVHKWRAIYPRAYHTHVAYWAKRFRAPQWMVYAHMLQESRYKPWMISNAPAYGLLELLDRTARRLAAERRDDYQLWMLMQPSHNIRWGTQYLGALVSKFFDQLPFAICSYNAGPMLLEHIMPREKGQDFDVLIDDINTHQARNYVRMVIGHFLRYLAIYETPAREAQLRKLLIPTAWKPTFKKEPSY